MKHFVVFIDWATEYDNGVTVLGVVHSMEEAKEIFNKSLAEEKQYAEENDFEIYEDCETVFDAGDGGYYIINHIRLCIEIV